MGLNLWNRSESSILMPAYKFAESAKQDIRDLVEYTIDAWSKAQAEKYYLGLTKQAELLAEMPTLGKLYDKYKAEEVRIFPYEKHLIYYIETPHGITILHVIQVNKDQVGHISGSENA